MYRSDSDISLESEKSYDNLFKKTEVSEWITYLIFDLLWMFITTLVNVILVILLTYDFVFDGDFGEQLTASLIIIACDIIVIIDVVGAVIHWRWKRYSNLKNLPPRNKVLITIDLLSVTLMITDIYPVWRNIFWIAIVGIVFASLRLYRLFKFFYVVSQTPGLGSLSMLVAKNGLIVCLVTHLFACVLELMKIDDIDNWTVSANSTIFFDGETAGKWYIVCLYFVLNTFCSVGFGDIYVNNDHEMIIMVALMLISFFLIAGLFVGALTAIKMESYRRHSSFLHRLNLISTALNHPKIATALKRKIINFYHLFWQQQKGIRYALLLEELPTSLKHQVVLDKYWNALQQSYLLRDLHPALLRAVAAVMRTEIFTVGEVIYAQGEKKDCMVYVLRGNIQLLSSEDGESPVLTLGMGTCIGDVNLIYNVTSPVQVVALSYCEIQRLSKSDFWRVAYKYSNLKQVSRIYDRLVKKIAQAKSVAVTRRSSQTDGREEIEMEQVLKTVKLKLQTENPKAAVQRKGSASAQSLGFFKLYILSLHQTTLRHSDEICLRTSWPWVMQPQSVLLTVWEYFVAICVITVTVLFPYEISFTRGYLDSLFLVHVVVQVVYFIDLIIQLFTAIDDENGVISKVSDIFTRRCRQLPFQLDVISSIPFILLASMFHITENERILVILFVAVIFKFHRVVMLFEKLGASFDVNIAIVRVIKYVLYFLLLSYLMGDIYYMVACFYEECTRNSWYEKIKEEDQLVNGTRYKNMFPFSIYFGATILTQSGFGDITPHTMLEVGFVMVFCMFGTALFCYLVSDFSATLMLAERAQENYIELVTVVKKFLTYNQMLPSIQHRTNEYLAFQWHINMGYSILKERSILFDAPSHLFVEQQIAKYYKVLMQIPLFKEIDSEYVKLIAAEVKQVFLPPYEIVTYAGEVVHGMYIIDEGFCEVISAASGKTEKVMGPQSHFCDFDMILGRPGILHIRTVTCARILKISFKTIKKVFVKANMLQGLKTLAGEVKSSLAVQRLYLRRDNVTYLPVKEESRASWFIFPKEKVHPSSIDYERAFQNMGIWRFFRAVLLRRTIRPDGKFLFVWETIQCIRILIISHYYISIFIVQAFLHTSEQILIAINFLGVIDLYVRMHVCYYNEKGILITHPRFTARHYLRTSFIVDFLSLLPLPMLINLISKEDRSLSKIYSEHHWLRFNALLQVYRLLGIFSYLQSDILRSRSITLGILKLLPISLIFFNAMAVVLLSMTCEFLQTGDDSLLQVIPSKYSWIAVNQEARRFNVTSPMNLFVSAYYVCIVTGLQEGYGTFRPWQVSEMFFIIAVAISGYLLFTYVLVLISSSKAKLNVHLTLYQEHMKHLIQYMRRENINKCLQKRVIDHFEYMWQRTHGMKASEIMKKCHLALQKDAVLYLYGQTFAEVPIFVDMSQAFYRNLGLHMEEAYFLNYSHLIKLNDIIDCIYIIHKGEVAVTAPDGMTFAILTKGCVFGNIDRSNESRSMTSVVAITAVDVLYIQTERFYELAVDYPTVIERLRRHVIVGNLSYIEKNPTGPNTGEIKRWATQNQETNTELSEHKHNESLISRLPVPMMLMSFFSCLVVTYHFAFQEHTTVIFIITYFLDVIHLFKLYTGFYTPYVNNMGELVTDYKQIRNRYLSFSRFYLEVLAILPIEIFALLASSDTGLFTLSLLRINRLLRLMNIYHFFNVTYDRLNINVLIIRIGSIATYFVLMVHIGSCMLYMVACPGGICDSKGWLYNNEAIVRPNNHYIISVYFMVAIITCTGFGDVQAGNLPEMVICAMIMLSGKFMMAIFIGDVSSMVQNYSYTLVRYDYNMTTLKEYLQHSYVAGPLITKILNYFDRLWQKDWGLQLPVLLQEAPIYLLEDVKSAAYGKHFYENYVFVRCHVDFLRQLMTKVKAQTFFQGDIIAHQGDVNNTMFFVHKGIVTMHITEGADEIQVETLHELDCFGIVQGLIASTPHTHTYKAETVAVILTLELYDWVHLLRYFRASRYEIYHRVIKMMNNKRVAI